MKLVSGLAFAASMRSQSRAAAFWLFGTWLTMLSYDVGLSRICSPACVCESWQWLSAQLWLKICRWMRSKVPPKSTVGSQGPVAPPVPPGGGGPGLQVSWSLSVSLYCLPCWKVERVTILISFFARLHTLPGNGPPTTTCTLVVVVHLSTTSVGSSRPSRRACSAWNSVSNLGSPLSSACSTVAERTPASVHRSGSKVLLAHAPTTNSHTPFTVPSLSQLGSPSVQVTFFGLVGGSFAEARSARRQSVFELPPPPMVTVMSWALVAVAAASHTPATIASEPDPPRIGAVSYHSRSARRQ